MVACSRRISSICLKKQLGEGAGKAGPSILTPGSGLAHVAHCLQLSNAVLAVQYITSSEQIQHLLRSATIGSGMLAGSLDPKAGQVGEGELPTLLYTSLYKPLLLVAINSSVEQAKHMLQAGVVGGLLCHCGRFLDCCQSFLSVTET